MSAALVVMEDTALTTAEKETFIALGNPIELTDDQLADTVIQVFAKIRDHLPYIIALKSRFEDGERDSAMHLITPIKGCYSWKEFCGSILNRTPQALGQAIAAAKKPKEETHTVTAAEFAEYEQKNKGIRKLTEKLLAEMPAADVASALMNMGHPEPMAISAVRFLSGAASVSESPTGMPESLQDIRLTVCSRTDPRYKPVRDEHYVDNHGCIGQQVHFLIDYKGRPAGIISGASAAYATKSRDEFFGITKENRHEVLSGVVDNIVFRLENHEPNLATRVLRLWREIVPHIWYEKYGVVVFGFETFVVENDTRKGALYKADNWTLAGATSGATKVRNGIENPADNWKQVVPKLVFCKWRDGFTAPCSARTPEWVQKMCGEILRSADSQPWKPRTVEERQAAAGVTGWRA
jgi:Domain of unknown function (DUF4338)